VHTSEILLYKKDTYSNFGQFKCDFSSGNIRHKMSDVLSVTDSFSYDENSDFTVELTDYENDDDEQNEDKLKKEFFNLIRMRKASSVKHLLDSRKDFDLNCNDYRGMTGLNVAIEINCEPIVDLLLSRAEIEIGDSLMYAIRDNRYSITEKLLNIFQSENSKRVQLGCNSTGFPPYLTPLMLAAQCGNLKIICLLLNRGHTIQMPHKPGCSCKEVNFLVLVKRSN